MLIFWMIAFAINSWSVLGNSTKTEDCSELEPLCLKCRPETGCIKCPEMIVYSTRKCVSTCPFGYRPIWSTYVEYMGLLCTPNGNLLGFSYDSIAILTGITTGIVLCTIFISVTILYFKYRRRKENATSSIESSSDIEDSSERRREFLKQLETFKPYAQIFLDMLNDTRRRMRDLYNNEVDNNSSAIQAYRPVVRDLTKILILLNRNSEKIVVVPDDWEHLLNWAEQTLQRYKRMSECSQIQMAQLVNFLQKPIVIKLDDEEKSCSNDDLKCGATMSTFKPNQVMTNASSLQDIAIHNFNSNYDLKCFNPQWKFQYSLVSSSAPTTEFNPGVWRNSKEFLNSPWLIDDEFLQLGFRPQDEITTEL